MINSVSIAFASEPSTTRISNRTNGARRTQSFWKPLVSSVRLRHPPASFFRTKRSSRSQARSVSHGFGIDGLACLVTNPTSRPEKINTNIYFYDTQGKRLIQVYDCSSAPEVNYTDSTIFIRFPVAPWLAGRSYYVTFDRGRPNRWSVHAALLLVLGVASGSGSCRE